MPRAFIGEIRLFASEKAVTGWFDCGGQGVPVRDYPELSAVIGQAFGGDGATLFKLPDLRGRVPMHRSSAYAHAQQGGTETVTLGTEHLPKHGHVVACSASAATTAVPDGRVLAAPPDVNATPYGSDQPRTSLFPRSVGFTSTSPQPHENLQPYVALRYLIAARPMDVQDDRYIGEIRAFAFGIVPDGWVPCDGRLLSGRGDYQLFSLIGTTFGGDSSAFKVPNLTGTVAVGVGAGAGLSPYVLGDTGGTETATLTSSGMPQHQHALVVSAGAATSRQPAGQLLARGSGGVVAFVGESAGPTVALSGSALSTAGGGQPHNNMQPFLTVLYCIARTGQYPPVD